MYIDDDDDDDNDDNIGFHTNKLCSRLSSSEVQFQMDAFLCFRGPVSRI